jgi:hypothetical protein
MKIGDFTQYIKPMANPWPRALSYVTTMPEELCLNFFSCADTH